MNTNKNLIVKKAVVGAPDWSVVKYDRKVFFNNLWNSNPEYVEARGKVIDSEGNVVAMPLRKVFNYLENGAGKDLKPETLVEVTKKINGSMFHVTHTPRGLLFGTTGSAVLEDAETQNDFLNRGRLCFFQHVDPELFKAYSEGNTFIFEVVDKVNDPHIIPDEQDGLYLLAVRDLDGDMKSTAWVELAASMMNYDGRAPNRMFCPKSSVVSWQMILDAMKTCKHEGYMVRLFGESDFLLKLKSPYYLNKKRAQRIKPEKLFSNEWREYFDDDFYATIEEIRKDWTLENWADLEETTRSAVFVGTYNYLLNQVKKNA